MEIRLERCVGIENNELNSDNAWPHSNKDDLQLLQNLHNTVRAGQAAVEIVKSLCCYLLRQLKE